MALTDKVLLATIGKFLNFSDVQKVFQVRTSFRRMKEAYEAEHGHLACICGECFTEHGWQAQNRSSHHGQHVSWLNLNACD